MSLVSLCLRLMYYCDGKRCLTSVMCRRFRSTSPTPLSRSMESPRSPPAKVGSIMWGSDTPLAQKGTTPYLAGAGSSKWVCSVCYFTENQEEAQSCEVCDSPNYSINKVMRST